MEKTTISQELIEFIKNLDGKILLRNGIILQLGDRVRKLENHIYEICQGEHDISNENLIINIQLAEEMMNKVLAKYESKTEIEIINDNIPDWEKNPDKYKVEINHENRTIWIGSKLMKHIKNNGNSISGNWYRICYNIILFDYEIHRERPMNSSFGIFDDYQMNIYKNEVNRYVSMSEKEYTEYIQNKEKYDEAFKCLIEKTTNKISKIKEDKEIKEICKTTKISI